MNVSRTNTSQGLTSVDDSLEDICASIFLFLVIIFGIVGNLFVIIIIFKRRRPLDSNYYYLVLHLAVCDFSLLICNIPKTYYTSWLSMNLVSSNVLCDIWRCLDLIASFFLLTGTHIMTLIAIVRHQAVVYPLRATLSRKKLTMVICVIYSFGFVYFISHLFVIRFYHLSDCFDSWSKSKLNVIFNALFSLIHYFAPITFMSIMYFKIWRTLSHQHKNWQTTGNDALPGYLQQSVQARKHQHKSQNLFLNIAVVFCFAVTGLPMQIEWILHVTGSNENIAIASKWVFAFYLGGTSAVNPYLYGTMDKRIRSVVKRAVKDWRT